MLLFRGSALTELCYPVVGCVYAVLTGNSATSSQLHQLLETFAFLPRSSVEVYSALRLSLSVEGLHGVGHWPCS